MEKYEKEKLVADLESGRQMLLDALNGVTEDVATRTLPGRWSVLECVEHLVVSEDYLFSQIVASHSSPGPVLNEKREALIVARGADRTKPVSSPEVGKPAGRFSTLADAVNGFLASRQQTIRFVENCTEDLRSKLTTHPLIGNVNCYETLLMIAVHPKRHAEQIQEIKATLG
jgi:DinB superfamily